MLCSLAGLASRRRQTQVPRHLPDMFSTQTGSSPHWWGPRPPHLPHQALIQVHLQLLHPPGGRLGVVPHPQRAQQHGHVQHNVQSVALLTVLRGQPGVLRRAAAAAGRIARAGTAVRGARQAGSMPWAQSSVSLHELASKTFLLVS